MNTMDILCPIYILQRKRALSLCAVAKAVALRSEHLQLAIEQLKLASGLAVLAAAGRCSALDRDEVMQHHIEWVRRAPVGRSVALLWVVRMNHDAPGVGTYILIRSAFSSLSEEMSPT